jgi:hypothetical protein
MIGQDIVVRLSVAQLEELLERAESGNYMLIHSDSGEWVQIHPYVEEEGTS